MTADVRRLDPDRINGPYCMARVQTKRLSNSEVFARQKRTQMRGVAFNQCAAVASHEINGMALCRKHAGEVCVKYFEDLARKP